MSKYGDDHVCTCEMELVSCKNEFHAEHCELWQEPSFVANQDEWDGDLGCLVLQRSPWQHPEDFIWDGDSPVVSVETAEERSDLADKFMSDLEAEALEALKNEDGVESDEFGWIVLPDGSFADFTQRVTYRRVTVENSVCWQDEPWDDETTALVPVEAPACVCTPEKKFYCWTCEVERSNVEDSWAKWDRQKTTGGSTYGGGTTTTTYWGGRCSHTFETFLLPGAQHENIKISARRQHTKETMPDYGLYAYHGWDPSCVATLLPWADYGLPTVPFEQAAQAIKYAYDLALSGSIVEVGCMGGHGRTGTILGCMAILSDPEMTAKQAVDHVRRVHCNEAIETNEQEWFVAWFLSWYNGSTCPPRPTTYVSKHSKNWQAAGSAAAAVKTGANLLPLVPTSPVAGPSTKPSTPLWCSGCMRTVYTEHNNDCAFSEPTLAFRPEVIAGETANARRRNAKRANRRAAAKARKTEEV